VGIERKWALVVLVLTPQMTAGIAAGLGYAQPTLALTDLEMAVKEERCFGIGC
jgi:hypothetical protein